LLSFAILSNHYHLMLRSRPDVVATWDDSEVARRWLMICPHRKNKDGTPHEPNQQELRAILNCKERLAEIRLRLSDISWWMRLLDQRIARRCNDEDEAKGRFFEDRFKAIPLIDEQAITACAVYIDLNLIRARVAETVELSDHTSGQLRAAAFQASMNDSVGETAEANHHYQPEQVGVRDAVDAFLSPIQVSANQQASGAMKSQTGKRCSDKGFLEMSARAYLQLLDWTARQSVVGKRGATSDDPPPILERLKLPGPVWLRLVAEFGKLFPTMAGLPRHVEQQRSHKRGLRFRLPVTARDLLAQSA
jgi:hypothetical protein